METSQFPHFFQEVTGFDPFPWQRRLAEDLCRTGWDTRQTWSAVYGLPTASGKTSIQICWTFALAYQLQRGQERTLPLRLFWCIDRRTVVDQAHDQACQIRQTLQDAKPGSAALQVREALACVAKAAPLELDCPFQAVRMRGGLFREESWLRDPRIPSIISTTIDQMGSALLFRRYGVSHVVSPLYAGLAANDSAIINDESHLASAFMRTLERIKEASHNSNLTLLRVSATARDTPTFTLDASDLEHPVLQSRLCCTKKVRLVAAKTQANRPPTLCREAKSLANGNVVAVICNTVGVARSVFNGLVKDKKSDTILLTGRSRQWERDRILKDWGRFIRTENRETPSRTLYVVSTQCIEAGCNFDFDEMVTEVAPLDCLAQRAGRLGRAGGRSHTLTIVGHTLEGDATSDKLLKADPIYDGQSLATWAWLGSQTGNLDFSHNGQLQMQNTEGLASPQPESPFLTSDLFEAWAQTYPRPANGPDLDPFLHGYQRHTDVTLVWRADLDTGPLENPETWAEDLAKGWHEIVGLAPPMNGETLTVPIWEAQKFLGLGSRKPTKEVADVITRTPQRSLKGETLPVLRWKDEDSEVVTSASKIRPGDVLVMPAAYGGADSFGWTGNPQDIPADLVAGILEDQPQARQVVRLHPALLSPKQWSQVSAWVEEDALTAAQLRELLVWKGPLQLSPYPAGAKGAFVVSDRDQKPQRDSGNWSSISKREVLLQDHCQGVGFWAHAYASDLWAAMAPDLETAGIYHDIGKGDPRWQNFITGGFADATKPVAKATRPVVLSYMKKGLRHEFASLHLMETSDQDPLCDDLELVQHLVATHHGRGRCFAPPYDDQGALDYEMPVPTGNTVKVSTAYPYAQVASGWSDRFFAMLQKYGPWKLAYLETMLRLADWRASMEEQSDA